ncbi:hypothetical protein PIB30_025260 [Stylosanthes scabra]|uniref:Stress induced protein n=1 Tax=Stylosanthes scabra TaxID=79078 RepID=A0ABU6T9Q8_9FABA|nr:hypothetical protein [Stylosanthes scabra]
MAAFEARPLVEHEEEYSSSSDDHPEPGSMCGSGCFQVFELRQWRSHGEGRGLAEQNGESWLRCRLRKMKEISEVIAGPKWKTFIRKLSVYGKKQQRKNMFQYDEHSYALNFNSGVPSEDEDMPPSFSARFSAPFAAAAGHGGQTEQRFEQT